MQPTPFYVKINTSSQKVSKKCGLLMQFLKKLPKVNNRPLGENSPNLVTLVTTVSERGRLRQKVSAQMDPLWRLVHFTSQLNFLARKGTNGHGATLHFAGKRSRPKLKILCLE
jgi:hypothetical protein